MTTILSYVTGSYIIGVNAHGPFMVTGQSMIRLVIMTKLNHIETRNEEV